MTDPTPQSAGQVPASQQSAQSVADEGDVFDKDRALATIQKLREFEKNAKAQLKEYDALKTAQAERERKLAEEQGNFKALYEQQQAEAAKLADRVAQFELHQKQVSVAQELGLPLALADRLRGETPAELKADAQRILDLMKPATQSPGGATVTPTNPQTSRQVRTAFDPKNPPRLADIEWKK